MGGTQEVGAGAAGDGADVRLNVDQFTSVHGGRYARRLAGCEPRGSSPACRHVPGFEGSPKGSTRRSSLCLKHHPFDM